MTSSIKVIILCLCAAISVTSTDNDFKKYLSAKKSSFDYLPASTVGMYKNWTISFWANGVHFIDVDTGALVKTIIGSFTLTDGNGLISGAEVVDKYLMIYFSDSVIQHWDLDTGEIIVREIKPSRSSTLSRECVWHFDLDLVFCSLTNGFVRKINMATKKIETEFDAHDNYCYLLVNGSLLYTASFDGLVKKFDLFGNLLNTFELTLGYANILACEGEYLFVNYYNIDVDRKVRIVRWNHITGIPEDFPVPMSTILDPKNASRDYYFAVSLGPLGFEYAQFFKSNLSVVRADLNGQTGYWTLKFPSNGMRFFFASNNTMVELFLSNEGLTRGESIYLKYTTPTISNFVVLNETTMIAVSSTQSNVKFTSRFIDLPTGFFSKVVDTFAGHSRFLVSGDFIYAAVGTKVVAYHMANLSLAWASPDISPQNIGYFQIKDGLIYLSSQNYVGWYNTSTFDRIGSIILGDVSYGTFDILNGVLYAFYTSNSVYALDLTD
ncbi:hypothetical protein MP638_002298, partial [Amoeboaphelidium occidentale]